MNERAELTIPRLFDLSGKVALVTGGSGWLGRAFCEALAEAGATVVVSSRNPERAAETASELPVLGQVEHLGIVLDQTNDASLQDGFQQATRHMGSVDILVNNGLDPVFHDLDDISFDEFARHQVNNAGYFALARLVHDQAVRNSAAASIVNIGSMYGQVASYPQAYDGICTASSVAYHALKGGTIQMTRHLAAYWAKDKVRINCLSPGPFPNPQNAPVEMIQRLERHVPLGRMGRPEELKGAIVFLASDASSYMTGENLTIDGGWTAW